MMIIGFPIIWIFEKITKLFSKDKPKEIMTNEEMDTLIDM
jgi:hypothetical protein